ncbi:hypothetical protein JOM56_012286 [Amanita muscaria]
MAVCVHCNNRTFVNEDALRQHLKSSSAHPFCTPCNRHFVNEKAYEAHMTSRHPPTFDCTKCNRTYRSHSSLEDHYRGSPAHPNCSRCGKGFRNKRSVEEHFAVQHSLVSCPCSPMALYFDELDEHYLTSDAHPSCLACNCGFKDDESYREHLVSTHTNVYCAPCRVQFETPEALSEHHLVSPRHPTCMTCGKGFKDDQEFTSHLLSMHGDSPTTVAPNNNVASVQRSFIPIRVRVIYASQLCPHTPSPQRPIVRTDSPALSLCPDFASPIMDVKAPVFTPSSLPPPGGIVDDIWAMRENTQAPIPRKPAGRTGFNDFSPVLESLYQRKYTFQERQPYNPMRDSWFLSSIKAEPSPLGNAILSREQDTDGLYLPTEPITQSHHEETRDVFMRESDPIVPLERGARTENACRAIGTPPKERQSNLRADAQPFFFPRTRASSSSVQSSSESTQSSPTFSSPKSDSNAVPFIVSSPFISGVFQASECGMVQTLDKGSDLLLSTMATPIASSPNVGLPSAVDAALLSIPNYTMVSPTDSGSPDVSSPLNLNALPSVSPLTTTPIERSRSLSGKDAAHTLDAPEAQGPLPGSPSEETPTSIDEGADEETPMAPGPAERDLSVITTGAAALSPSDPSPETCSVYDFIDEVDSFSDLESSTLDPRPTSPSFLTNNTTCSPSPPSLLQSSLPTPTTAVEPLSDHSETSHPPFSRLLHCRLCQADMCNDPTATMCGHLFCYRCITESVIRTPRCPACAAPTLLYCLFRLDLSA